MPWIDQRFKTETLHIFTLTAFAVAQPLFDLLSGQTGFLIAHHAGLQEILALTFTLTVGLPLLLVLLKELPGLCHAGIRRGLHTAWLVLLVMLFVLPLVKRTGLLPDAGILFLGGLAGALFAFLYWTKERLRSFVTFLSPAIFIFPLLFLFFSKVTPLFIIEKPVAYTNPNVTAEIAARQYPPVVMIIWDELPISTLLDADGGIDAVRYPNFAAFSRSADWCRNANTVAGSTIWAVPAILTGQMPHEDPKPSPAQLSTNIFTLLAKTHTFHNVIEEQTSLCPANLCMDRNRGGLRNIAPLLRDVSYVYAHMVVPKSWEAMLPDISGTWGDFQAGKTAPGKVAANPPVLPGEEGEGVSAASVQGERKAGGLSALRHGLDVLLDNLRFEGSKKWAADQKYTVFTQFLSKMQPGALNGKPPLYLIHIVLPHIPYNYLPSGKYYSVGPHRYSTKWQSEREIYYDYQRHLLQTGAVDNLMGLLMTRLKQLGLYDKALIVVTADHGASWAGIGTERRQLGWDNYRNILPVPLFIKQPGQHQARVIRREVLSIDILPSIADIVHLPLPGKTDGHSFLSDSYPELTHIRAMGNQGKSWSTFPLVTEAEKQDNLARKLKWFGSGDSRTIFTTPPFLSEYIGQPVSRLPVTPKPADSWTFAFASPEYYANVDLNGRFIPAQVEGTIQTRKPGAFPDDVLIAVNDVIRASWPYLKKDGEQLDFAAMVPEASFKSGKNSIRLFAVRRDGNRTSIEEISPKPYSGR